MFIEIHDIRKHFGEGESRVDVLNGIDISIEKGEICVLLGPSGSGKSTLLNIIGGIDNADEGYISINGEKTKDMNEKALTTYRRKHKNSVHSKIPLTYSSAEYTELSDSLRGNYVCGGNLHIWKYDDATGKRVFKGCQR